MIVLSIVTPCYNEEAGITECYEAVRAVMEAELPEFCYEHIFIDNCSEDRTVSLLRAIRGDGQARQDNRQLAKLRAGAVADPCDLSVEG